MIYNIFKKIKLNSKKRIICAMFITAPLTLGLGVFLDIYTGFSNSLSETLIRSTIEFLMFWVGFFYCFMHLKRRGCLENGN